MADERLIPGSIRDESTLAFNALIDRMGSLNIEPLLVYLIDDAPAAALPHLAEQFHVSGYEGWLLCQTDADKRALIKTSIGLHRYKGTPYAIKRVLDVLGFQGELLEWFQYAGSPYYFRLALISSTGRQVLATDMASLRAMVDEYKNVRSRCESISLTAVQPGTIYVATGSVIGITVVTQPHP